MKSINGVCVCICVLYVSLYAYKHGLGCKFVGNFDLFLKPAVKSVVKFHVIVPC